VGRAGEVDRDALHIHDIRAKRFHEMREQDEGLFRRRPPRLTLEMRTGRR
jgi:hypothetical protein